jgi:hypothetical protein
LADQAKKRAGVSHALLYSNRPNGTAGSALQLYFSSGLRDGFDGTGVRFAPKATELPRGNGMTLRAKS